jgi:hypothetical protein
LNSVFASKTSAEQHAAIAELQLHAQSAGFAGTVVPIWDDYGRMSFIAPTKWHPFFKSLPLSVVYSNLNKELFW